MLYMGYVFGGNVDPVLIEIITDLFTSPPYSIKDKRANMSSEQNNDSLSPVSLHMIVTYYSYKINDIGFLSPVLIIQERVSLLIYRSTSKLSNRTL